MKKLVQLIAFGHVVAALALASCGGKASTGGGSSGQGGSGSGGTLGAGGTSGVGGSTGSGGSSGVGGSSGAGGSLGAGGTSGSGSSDGGTTSACIEGDVNNAAHSSKCYPCASTSCSSELGAYESACSAYLSCVCPGGNFDASVPNCNQDAACNTSKMPFIACIKTNCAAECPHIN